METTAERKKRAGQPLRVASVHLDFARKRIRQDQVLHMSDMLAGHAGPLEFSYEIPDANQTHATVAQALADRINVWGLPEFRAATEGGVTVSTTGGESVSEE